MNTLKSNKRDHKFCANGYMYTKLKDLALGVRWRCFKRGKNCKGALIVNSATQEHNKGFLHTAPRLSSSSLPDDAAINVAKTRMKMKDVVVPMTVRDFSEEGKCLMNREHNLKECIRQQ